jgi:hypothetical protein
MCRDEFNKTVRPYVGEFPIGMRGIGFDREELDVWADEYAVINAIEKKRTSTRGFELTHERIEEKMPWREKQSPASRKGPEFGTLTNESKENAFTKALELVTGRKPSAT